MDSPTSIMVGVERTMTCIVGMCCSSYLAVATVVVVVVVSVFVENFIHLLTVNVVVVAVLY